MCGSCGSSPRVSILSRSTRLDHSPCIMTVYMQAHCNLKKSIILVWAFFSLNRLALVGHCELGPWCPLTACISYWGDGIASRCLVERPLGQLRQSFRVGPFRELCGRLDWFDVCFVYDLHF